MLLLILAVALTCLMSFAFLLGQVEERFFRFFQYGVNFLQDNCYVNLRTPCYYIDPQTDTLERRQMFTALGMVTDARKDIFLDWTGWCFAGVMELDTDTRPLHQVRDSCDARMDEHILTLECSGPDTLLQARILRDDPDVILLTQQWADGTTHRYICGWSIEDARDNYRIYLEHPAGESHAEEDPYPHSQ